MNLVELKGIFSSFPMGILILENRHTIKYVNTALTRIMKTDIDKSQILNTVSKVLSGGSPAEISGRLKKYVLCRLSSFIDEDSGNEYMIFYLNNNMLSKLEDNLYIYSELLNSITDLGLLAINKNEEIILYNNASATQDHMKRDDVIGKKFDDVFTKTVNSALTEALYTGKPVVNQEVMYTTSSGINMLSLSNAYPVLKKGEVVAAFSIVHFHEDIQYLLQKTIELQQKLLNIDKGLSNNTRFQFDDIIGKSPILLRAIEMAKKVAFTTFPVLIYGETGTGKELFAQSIHNAGPNGDKPFIALNCAAIPENLLESTLFGTTKGAFTGAGNTPGLFEQAQNGTLFLDELNSMPISLQSKLLRVLQEKRVRPLGSKDELPVNCRIIASTNIPLQQCLEENIIRADLYYRLSVICIEIPPLRERGRDILILSDYFIEKQYKNLIIRINTGLITLYQGQNHSIYY